MRALLIMVMVLVSPALCAAEPDAATLKARAALALAFAVPKPPTYAEAYAKAVEGGKPLVVYVGQPVREMPGCVCVGLGSFPGVEKEAVVIGFPEGNRLRRVDVPGKPSAEVLRAVIGSPPGASAAVLPAGR